MLKATENGVVQTGDVWQLTEEDIAQIADIFNESTQLSTPCKDNNGKWIERDKSVLRDTDNYHIFTRHRLETE